MDKEEIKDVMEKIANISEEDLLEEEETIGARETQQALLNILEDVEEARARAVEERNKTLAIITNFTDGLLFFNKEKKLSLVNPTAESFFEVRATEIIGTSFLKLAEYPLFSPLINLLAKEGKGLFRRELKIEENLVLEVSTVPVVRGKENLGSLIILHDITREKGIERMKSEFVSLAAHQLRTPLSAIKWTLKMILEGDLGKINKDQRDYLEKSYVSNERMIHLINDLLNVSRIEEGRYLYKPVLISLERLVKEVIDSLKTRADAKNIKLIFKKPDKQAPKIRADEEKMKLAISNLVENSLRYTSSRGQVVASLSHKGKRVELSVKDNGIGIPKDQQKRVFSKFFRAANAMKKETEGSGLGLFITKNIIETHKGKVWFESEEGKGTTFYLSLPIGSETKEYFKRF